MAVSALHSAATGLTALSTEIDVIANNLANVNTAGFKSFRANFEDLMYEQKKQPGVENANGDRTPAGLFVGLGTQVSNTQQDFTQGSATPTGNPLDIMISGRGFMQVSILEELGDGVGYTRAGNFFINPDGNIVLGNSQGPLLEPPISVPAEATDISISPDGIVRVIVAGDAEPVQVGQIELASFVNPAGLKPIGGNVWVESAASGPPINGNPGEGGFGTILQGHLEASNVEPVRELVQLIKTQRAFELNSQSIQAADEALQVISNLRRF
jgi:flagellar basal-body rod protein FlgG